VIAIVFVTLSIAYVPNFMAFNHEIIIIDSQIKSFPPLSSSHQNKTINSDIMRTMNTINNYKVILNRTLNSVTSDPIVSNTTPLQLCPLIPPKLVGRLKVLTESPSFNQMEALFPDLEPGGRFKPSDCIPRHKVAIIIPYRDREEHLRIFLHNIHPILQRQQLDYGIYIVEEVQKDFICLVFIVCFLKIFNN
jgi:hypothetical protein